MGMLVNSAGVWTDVLNTTGGGTGIERVDLVKTAGGSGSTACYYKLGHLVLLVMTVVTTEDSKSATFKGAPIPVEEISEYKHINSNQNVETLLTIKSVSSGGRCTITYNTSSIGATGRGTLFYLTSE